MTHSLNSLSSNAVRVAESSFFAFVTARTGTSGSAAGCGLVIGSARVRSKLPNAKHLTGATSLSMGRLVATLRSKSIEACKRKPARLDFGFFEMQRVLNAC
jgi:hypothetical protein